MEREERDVPDATKNEVEEDKGPTLTAKYFPNGNFCMRRFVGRAHTSQPK